MRLMWTETFGILEGFQKHANCSLAIQDKKAVERENGRGIQIGRHSPTQPKPAAELL